MGKFNKFWFKQIMLPKLIKQQLSELKSIVAIETNATHKISYGDVILFLLNKYKESKQIEFPVEEKLLMSVPLKQVPLSYSEKLDGKTRVSFSVES